VPKQRGPPLLNKEHSHPPNSAMKEEKERETFEVTEKLATASPKIQTYANTPYVH
jgi:hypothetical protein